MVKDAHRVEENKIRQHLAREKRLAEALRANLRRRKQADMPPAREREHEADSAKAQSGKDKPEPIR